jgi:hypothetical protein
MIHQFSATFDEIQDRVLFLFNTKEEQEFRFWLTRRIVIVLLKALPRDTEQGNKIISQIKNTGITKKLPSIEKETENDLSSLNLDNELAFDGSNAKTLKKDGAKLEQEVKNTNIQTSKFKAGKLFPIGEEPVLVRDIKIKRIERIQKLQFILVDNKNVTCNLSLATFLSLHSLLEITFDSAQWDVQLLEEWKINNNKISIN